MRHKHADLIHAWAEGAEIQQFYTSQDKWVTERVPAWHDHGEYRIKPTPKPDVELFIGIDGGNRTHAFYSLTEARGKCWPMIIKAVKDGETGELKSAEVLE